MRQVCFGVTDVKMVWELLLEERSFFLTLSVLKGRTGGKCYLSRGGVDSQANIKDVEKAALQYLRVQQVIQRYE